MRILRPKRYEISRIRVADDENEQWDRVEYSDKTIEWQPVSFDGDYEDGDSELEKQYQELLKSFKNGISS